MMNLLYGGLQARSSRRVQRQTAVLVFVFRYFVKGLLIGTPRPFADRATMVCFFREPSFYEALCQPIAAFAGSCLINAIYGFAKSKSARTLYATVVRHATPITLVRSTDLLVAIRSCTHIPPIRPAPSRSARIAKVM